MSWEIIMNAVEKEYAEQHIKNLKLSDIDGPNKDQLEVGKRMALEAIKSIQGPRIYVGITGNANGTGWGVPDYQAADYINVMVTQLLEEEDSGPDSAGVVG